MTANDQIEMLMGDGRGGFTPGNFFRVGKRPYQRLRSAGLNGDGKPDIVTTNLDGDSVTVLLGLKGALDRGREGVRIHVGAHHPAERHESIVELHVGIQHL